MLYTRDHRDAGPNQQEDQVQNHQHRFSWLASDRREMDKADPSENYVVSIDNHMMEVVEADDTPVQGPSVTHVQVAPAQRYSVIVNTNHGKAGQGFWLRTGTDTGESTWVKMSLLTSRMPRR